MNLIRVQMKLAMLTRTEATYLKIKSLTIFRNLKYTSILRFIITSTKYIFCNPKIYFEKCFNYVIYLHFYLIQLMFQVFVYPNFPSI